MFKKGSGNTAEVWLESSRLKMMQMLPGFGALLLAGGLLCIPAPSAIAQAKISSAPLVQEPTPQTPIRAMSNVVLVPVFVYDQARMAEAPKEELPCARSTVIYFFKLQPTEPYLPKDCDVTEVRGLEAKDFRLFEDGAEQKIESLEAGMWRTVVRDNLGWHLQFSDTPTGIWSLNELSGLKKVPIVTWDFNILAYVPKNSKPGCHRLKVEVNRPNLLVFARDEYCTGQSPTDPLLMNSRGKELEQVLGSDKRGKIPLSIQAAAFYTSDSSGNGARLNIYLQFPSKDLYRKWDSSNWTLYTRIAVMGVIRTKDGAVAARFSDLLYPSYWPTFDQGGAKYISWAKGTTNLSGAIPRQLTGAASTSKLGSSNSIYGNNTLALTFPKANEVQPDYNAIETALNNSDPFWLPTRYETQVAVPPGDYNIEVVLSDEWKLGRAAVPIKIEPYDGKLIAMSSVTLCKRLRDAAVAAKETAAANFAPQYVPLESKGIQFTPAGDTTFVNTEPLFAYFEVYEPLREQSPATSVQLRLVDVGTGQTAESFAPLDAAPYAEKGGSLFRIARKIPIQLMRKGAYRLEVQATDSAGGRTAWRAVNFEVR